MSEPIDPVITPVVIEVVEAPSPGWVSDVMVLTKARLSAFVLITAFVGFLLASGDALDWFLLFRTLFGTAFVAAGASVLNQLWERKVDRLMARTKDRPLASGRMQPGTALGLGVLLGAAGIVYLSLRVNSLTAALAAATLAIYILCYTPMKRRSAWCVSIGAVSGAIPPMIGWAGAHGSLEAGAWVLFGILFFWQMPHFLAIAWMYRDEYAQAGFVMLRRNDIGGVKTAIEALLTALLLLSVTLLPVVMKLTLSVYGTMAVLCNLLICWSAIRFLVDRSRTNARRMFFASILYLPVILALLVFCKR